MVFDFRGTSTAAETRGGLSHLGRLLAQFGAVSLGLGLATSVPLFYVGYVSLGAGLIMARARWRPFVGAVPAACLMGWLCVSGLVAPHGHLGRLDALFLTVPLLFVSMAAARDELLRRLLLRAFFIGCVASGALAFVQLAVGYPGERPWRVDPDGVRWRFASGFLSHHIRFGVVMAIAAAVALGPGAGAALGRGASVFIRVWAALLAALSGSRGALMALVVAVCARLGIGAGTARLVRGLAITAAIGAGGIVTLSLMRPDQMRAMTETPDGRWKVWARASAMIAEAPVFGVGANGFEAELQRRANTGLDDRLFWDVTHAHNVVLGTAVRFGVPGLILFLWLILALLRWIYLNRELQPDAWATALSVSAAWFVAGMVEDVMAVTSTRAVFFTMLGLTVGAVPAPEDARAARFSPFAQASSAIVRLGTRVGGWAAAPVRLSSLGFMITIAFAVLATALSLRFLPRPFVWAALWCFSIGAYALFAPSGGKFNALAIAASACLATVLSFWFLPLPFAWAGLWWFSFCVYGLWRFSSRNLKLICVNAAAIVATFGLFEVYLYVEQTRGPAVWVEMRDEEGKATWMTLRDGLLGHTAREGRHVVTKYADGKTVYRVVYTVGKDRLRISPPSNVVAYPDCVLFFGGSFMFGEGVHDEEALPFQVGVKTPDALRVHNFGYQAYGPHQMLAQLEFGVVDSVIECQPRYAIYQAIDHHARRAAGPWQFDQRGPKYGMTPDGSVAYLGQYDSGARGRLRRWLWAHLGKSRSLRNAIYRDNSVTDEDIELMTGIVSKSKSFFESRYAGSEFHTIVWDRYARGEQLVQSLRAAGVRVHPLSGILPDFRNENWRYRLKGDNHPSALAHRLIAEYVVDAIVRQSDAD